MGKHCADLYQLCRLLEMQDKNAFAQECLSETRNAEVLFHCEGDGIGTDRILGVYETRYKIQNEVLKEKSVFGYEELLPCLRNEKDEHISGSLITTREATYIIFCTTDKSRLIGILKSTNLNLEKAKKLREYYKEKGSTDRSECYFQLNPQAC